MKFPPPPPCKKGAPGRIRNVLVGSLRTPPTCAPTPAGGRDRGREGGRREGGREGGREEGGRGGKERERGRDLRWMCVASELTDLFCFLRLVFFSSVGYVSAT